jgi:hypothetical protein
MEELGVMMETPGSVHLKFAMMMLIVEYLGTLLDRQHSKATGRSEVRFNTAIKRLFPTRYHHFTKPASAPNLFRDLRCPMIHRFETNPGIRLSSKYIVEDQGLSHLSYDKNGNLVLIAEIFFPDLKNAADRLISPTE